MSYKSLSMRQAQIRMQNVKSILRHLTMVCLKIGGGSAYGSIHHTEKKLGSGYRKLMRKAERLIQQLSAYFQQGRTRSGFTTTANEVRSDLLKDGSSSAAVKTPLRFHQWLLFSEVIANERL